VIKTRVTEMLGIEHPIVQAGMTGVSFGELAAAISNAGALGTVVSTMGAEGFRSELRIARSMTQRPLAVNFPHLVMRTWKKQEMWDAVEVAVDEGIKIAIMAAGDPDILLPRLKEAGMTVLHVGATVKHALKAQESGVDIFIANGAEAGGGASREQVGNLALAPQAVDALEIPVILGGSVIDERGLVAALALGAEGVYVGTRFIATHESPASADHKRAILMARDDSTSVSPGVGGRGLSKEFLQEVYPGVEASFGAGQGAGLVHDILLAAEVVERFVSGAEKVLARIEALGIRPVRTSG
jgi:NAD(P)H-dependent flavin oxidoreductase YrpB (nitropropane dioxygenase family)